MVEQSELVRCGNKEIDPNYLNYKGDPIVAPPLLTTSYLLFLINEFFSSNKSLKKKLEEVAEGYYYKEKKNSCELYNIWNMTCIIN